MIANILKTQLKRVERIAGGEVLFDHKPRAAHLVCRRCQSWKIEVPVTDLSHEWWFVMFRGDSVVFHVQADQLVPQFPNPIFNADPAVLRPVCIKLERKRRRPLAKDLVDQLAVEPGELHGVIVVS